MNIIPGCVYVSFHFHDGTLVASVPQASSEHGCFLTLAPEVGSLQEHSPHNSVLQ